MQLPPPTPATLQVPADEISGCPLVRDVFELTGDFCRLPKRQCNRHYCWEKLRRAEVDLERVRVVGPDCALGPDHVLGPDRGCADANVDAAGVGWSGAPEPLLKASAAHAVVQAGRAV